MRDNVWPILKYLVLFGWLWSPNDFRYIPSTILKVFFIAGNLLIVGALILALGNLPLFTNSMATSPIKNNNDQPQTIVKIDERTYRIGDHLFACTDCDVITLPPAPTIQAFSPAPTSSPMVTLAPVITVVQAPTPTPANSLTKDYYKNVHIAPTTFRNNDGTWALTVTAEELGPKAINAKTTCSDKDPNWADRLNLLSAYLTKHQNDSLILVVDFGDITTIDYVSQKSDGSYTHDIWSCATLIQPGGN